MNKSIVAISILALFISPVYAGEEPVLNIYNWSDYIAPGTIKKFEAATGIKVNYDVFDTNEMLEAKLLAGNSGYDLVVPTASFLERQIAAGLFQPLDKSKLPNLANLDPKIMAAVALNDPGNKYAIVYMWGTTGLGYNIAAIAKRLPDATVDSWDMLFNPEIVARFADCGVALLDAPQEVIPAALQYLGLDPLSENPEDLKKAEAAILAIRPYVKYFSASQYISDLANGDICLAQGYSGDVLQARDRADEAGQNVAIAYSIPKEGAVIWFDMMAIPADAPHPENALKFLNFIMEPQISAAITNYVWYANANAASYGLIDPEVTSDPGIYPSEAVKANLFALRAHPQRYDRLLNRAWTRIKTGR